MPQCKLTGHAHVCPPSKLPFPWGDLDPHVTHGYAGHSEPVSTDSTQTAAAVYVCSKCGSQSGQHDLYECQDAEQNTDARPMQSVSSGQHQVDATDADNVDGDS